jgi:membrane fusion protein, multidrug efflux system
MHDRSLNNITPEARRAAILLFVWRNLPRAALFCLVLLIIFLAAIIGREKTRLEEEKAAAQAQAERPVNTVLLELRPSAIQDAINLPGVMVPWISLELMAKVHGSIIEVLVQEGSVINQGDVLARIEPDDYLIALESAKAAYLQARADHERKKVMLSKKTASQADLEQSESRMLTAKAAMDDAELKLSRCTITAPINGVIRRLDAKTGLLLSIGDPIAEILQIDRLKAVVGIPESDVDAVRKLPEVAITVQALGDLEVTGEKYFFSPAPETTARLYRLELEIDNREGNILPGMFFRAHVVKKTVSDAISVPIYSVITRNNEQFVFIVRDQTVHKQPVKLGILEKWRVQITEGLRPGDRVIVEGHRDVEEGQEVNVIQVLTDPGGRPL